jgi:sugar phosphate permease
MTSGNSRLERIAFMGTLIVAGEAVFSLPFHVARFFRPAVLSVLDLSNTELGAAQAVYGVVAMLAYFPGGLLADRFPARRLLAGSLFATAAGGLYFATFPSYRGLASLFGFWGITTILLFWAALIRATREWGRDDEQGLAYGILDGGRGLFAAAFAAAAVAVFEHMLPTDPSTSTTAERAEALRGIIILYIVVTSVAGALCLRFVPEREPILERGDTLLSHLGSVLRMPRVWLQAVIVVCAYIGYKGIDNYSLYAVQGHGMNEVEGAKVSTLSAWIRPVAAVGAGWVADRVSASLVSTLLFALLLGSYVWLALDVPTPSTVWVLYLNVVITCVAVFGLRGAYFALFQEAAVPLSATGTAVGFVSVIGYTPDIFVNLVGGFLLDRSPGLGGHRHFFAFLASSAAVGLIAALSFRALGNNKRTVVEPG